VPAKLKELYQKKDYGNYTDANGDLPVCFITNNDITGGNSGSPVLDAEGNLIGLAFDGNSEAMSGDIDFEENMQRCINLDVRYMLFIIDKFAGARNLIEEMKIVQ
jgi:V8-like Glu-specific endopeptidase